MSHWTRDNVVTTLSTEGTRDHGTKSFAGWPVTRFSDALTSAGAVVRANFDTELE
jgi:hypothetical protein